MTIWRGAIRGLSLTLKTIVISSTFSEVCVDGVITGTEASMPTLPTGVTATDIQTIVSDVATGSTDYKGDWVYVEADCLNLI